MKRILVISASIGGGHVAAAKALETAFTGRGCDVMHVDVIDYTAAPLRRVYRQAYFDVVRTAPEVVDWLGRRLDRHPSEHKSRQARLRARLSRLVSIHLTRVLERYQPDLIVHTHFLAPEVLSTRLAPEVLRRRGTQRTIPQAVVITDFFAHSLWLQPRVAHYFVASQEVAVHLQACGVDSERVEVSGIPIDPRFAAPLSRAAARSALDYPPERDRLLVMAGGLEERLLSDLITSLKTLRWPLSVTLILGRSAELLELARRATAEDSDDPGSSALVDFDLVGFTSEVPTYMRAADLMLGKPGGLTSSEALASGLPFAVVQPYPVEEAANTSYLLEHGAAMRAEPLSVLSYKLKRFFEHPELRMQMERAARALAHPEAAGTVVESLLRDYG